MTRAAIAALALLLAPAPFAQGQEPAPSDPEPESLAGLLQQNSVADVYERAMSGLPKDDLSWVAIRSVVGPKFWDNAAKFLPDRMLKATLPKVGTGEGTVEEILGRVEEFKMSQVAVGGALDSDDSNGALDTRFSIGGILGATTELITTAGLALLGVFAVFYVIQAVWGFTRSNEMTIGWGPARLGASLSFLLPVGDQGFCVIQAVLIVFAQIGIGMANMAWDFAMAGFTRLANDEQAARQAAEEIFEIDAEDLAARAVATAICVSVNEFSSWSPRESGQAALPPKTESKGCGGLEPLAGARKRLAGLARAYGEPGAQVRDLMLRVYTERRDILLKLRSDVTAVMSSARGGNWWTRLNPPAKYLLEAVKKPEGINLLAVGPADIFTETAGEAVHEEGVVAPIMTHTGWWLLGQIAGPKTAGRCIAAWAGETPDGELRAHDIVKVLEAENGKGVLEKNRLGRAKPGALWGLNDSNGFLGGVKEYIASADSGDPAGCTLLGTDDDEDAVVSLYRKAVADLEATGKGADPDKSIATELRPLIQSLYSTQLAPLTGQMENGKVTENRRGWLVAGGVYWHIQSARRVNGILQQLGSPVVEPSSMDPADCGEEADCRKLHGWNIGMMIGNAARRMGSISTPALAYDPYVMADFAESESEGYGSAFGTAVVNFLTDEMSAVGRDGAPLSRLMWAGQRMVEWGAGFAIGGALASKIPYIGGASGFITTAGLGLAALGVVLAVWLPTLPLVAWLSSAWAWLVSIILGLLAAPLWALAHAIPDGRGPLSGYTRKGYHLIIFTAARPTFLVVGLLLAMTMSTLICKVGAVLFTVMIGGYGASAYVEGAGLLQSIYVILVAFVLFLFMAWLITKTFTLCHELPDKVFEWVGGAPSLGDQEMLREGRNFVGGMMTRGVSPVAGAAKGAARTLGAKGAEATDTAKAGAEAAKAGAKAMKKGNEAANNLVSGKK